MSGRVRSAEGRGTSPARSLTCLPPPPADAQAPRSPHLPAPGARVRDRGSPLGPKLLCAARAEPESSLLSSAERGWGGAGQGWTGLRDETRRDGRGGEEMGGEGGGVPGGRPAPPAAQAPRSRSVPTEYPPGGEILLHAQQPLPQGLQHLRRHRDSSPRVSERRRRPRPAHLSPARPQPPRPRPPAPAAAPSAFCPARRAGPAPRRRAAAEGRRAGLRKRGGPSLPSSPCQLSQRLGWALPTDPGFLIFFLFKWK